MPTASDVPAVLIFSLACVASRTSTDSSVGRPPGPSTVATTLSRLVQMADRQAMTTPSSQPTTGTISRNNVATSGNGAVTSWSSSMVTGAGGYRRPVDLHVSLDAPLDVPPRAMTRLPLTLDAVDKDVSVEDGVVTIHRRGWYEVHLTVAWDPSAT